MICPGNRVVIKQASAETVTPGGIIVPDKVQAKHRPRRGEVICAGVECKEVRVGDGVLFDEKAALYDGIPGEDGSMEEYAFCKEEDILVVSNRDFNPAEHEQTK